MTVPQLAATYLSALEFISWNLESRSGQRYELLDGAAIEMSAERLTHVRTKSAIHRQFERSIADGSLPCEAMVDGMAVKVDDANVFEPDVLVRCGPRLPGETLLIEDPVIVVEVASPSTQRVDALTKFARYFRNRHIVHYLIVVPRDRIVIHHRRSGDHLESATHESGPLRLDPPGLELSCEDLFSQD